MPSVAVDNGSTTTEHVPAWKRLGLKLKTAKDTAPDVHVSDGAPAVERRKPSDEDVSAPAQSGSSSLKQKSPSIVASPNWALKKSRSNVALEQADPRVTNASSGAEPSATARRSDGVNGTTEDPHSSLGRKRKRENNLPGETAGLIHDKLLQSSTASRPEADIETTTPAAKRRKSVVFTPDTKVEDGSSARDLFNAWAAQHPEHYDAQGRFSEPSQQAAAIVKGSVIEADQSFDKSIKKAKKEKNRQASGPEAVSASGTPIEQKKGPPAYLTYLQQYHSDRKNWKFNKSQQISLLKNLFDLHRIPAEHDEALASYIQGLQGEAAKQRLRSTAQQIVDGEPDTSTLSATSGPPQPSGSTTSVPDGPTAPNAAQDESFQAPPAQGEHEQHEQRLDEARLRQLKRERAQKVLRALETVQNSPYSRSNDATKNGTISPSLGTVGTSTTLATPMPSSGQPESKPAQAKKVTRKRKRRTDVSSAGSSSSSSSSSDEDADESSAVDEDTSSLSSSSSDVSDDSDSESSSSG